jgi:LysR family hydrogen peroxide-inducible transcriptional activator
MNLSSLSLRDLEYVVALTEFGHFGKAATAVHVSQPALSAQIKKVESLLGVSLFERSKRRVSVTSSGSAIAAQARIVLEEARKIYELSQASTKPFEGIFRLGITASVGPYYVLFLLRSVRTKFPKLELQLREGRTGSLLEQLRLGELDAVIASPTFNDPSLTSFQIFFEPFFLAAPVDSEIARRKESPAQRDLKASRMVLLKDGHCLRDQALDFCPRSKRGSIRQLHATLCARGFHRAPCTPAANKHARCTDGGRYHRTPNHKDFYLDHDGHQSKLHDRRAALLKS